MGFGFGYDNILPRLGGVIPPDVIFGADLYDWWDYTDDATLTKSGVRVLSTASKKSGSTRAMTSLLATAPQIVTNQVNGKQVARFDGVSEFAQVAASTALYNFLHNATGGYVFIVQRFTNGGVASRLLNNKGGNSPGLDINSGIGESISLNNDYVSFIRNTTAGTNVSQTTTANNTIIPNKFQYTASKYDASNATLAQRGGIAIDNGSIVQNNTDNATLSNTNAGYNLTLGRRVRLDDTYYKGDLCEIIITQNQPSSLQLTQMYNYAVNKYGSNFPIV